jgi:hypothetical protein
MPISLTDKPAVPGREAFNEAFGFRRMTTAMAIFENQADAQARGYLHRARG